MIRETAISDLPTSSRPRERRFFALLWDISTRLPNPYFLYDNSPTTNGTTGYPASYFIPRDEVTVGASSAYGPYKVSGYMRRDLTLSKPVGIGAHATYEDECFIFDVNFFRRYTSITTTMVALRCCSRSRSRPLGSSGSTVKQRTHRHAPYRPCHLAFRGTPLLHHRGGCNLCPPQPPSDRRRGRNRSSVGAQPLRPRRRGNASSRWSMGDVISQGDVTREPGYSPSLPVCR